MCASQVTLFHRQEPGWLNELGSLITYQLIQAFHQYCVGLRSTL